MTDLVTGLIVGFVAAIVLMCLVLYPVARRLTMRHEEDLRRYGESIIDLRQERAEDKETNRRLRHQLVANSPDRLVEIATNAELERDSALGERDQALEQLHLLQRDLSLANGRLTDREAKLRQYREALKEIRISLEAQDQVRASDEAEPVIGTTTDEVPAAAFGEPVERSMADSEPMPRPQSVPEPADVSAVD